MLVWTDIKSAVCTQTIAVTQGSADARKEL